MESEGLRKMLHCHSAFRFRNLLSIINFLQQSDTGGGDRNHGHRRREMFFQDTDLPIR